MKLSVKEIGQSIWICMLTFALYFSGLFVFWTPLPLFYSSFQFKKKQWFMSFLAMILLAVFLHIQFVRLWLFAYYLLIACLLSVGVWKRLPLVRWGGFVGLSVTVTLLLTGLFCQVTGYYDVKAVVSRSVQEAIALLDQMMASPSFKGDRLEVLTVIAQTKKWVLFLPKLIPSLVFTFTVFVMMLNVLLVKFITRLPKPLKWDGDFQCLQLPIFCVWIVILAGFGFFLDDYFLKMGRLKIVAINLFVFGAFVYFIQGLSIVSFFLKRYSPLFRFGIYGLLILFFQMLGFVVFGLGLADTWLDFRKLQKQT